MHIILSALKCISLENRNNTHKKHNPDNMKRDEYSFKRCGRLEFLLSLIVIFTLIACLWLLETRYTRLWDADSIQHFITICGHEIIRINAYQMHIIGYVLLFGFILGNLTISLFGLFLMVITINTRTELLYLLLYVGLYVTYYYQGLRRSRDMNINLWRMLIPIYMPIALFIIKGKEKSKDDDCEKIDMEIY